jgi:DNA-directed RNA polymerase specialized sigma24 family protein
MFADVVRQHGDAVLSCCAERLWPDADAAIVAACDVLITARLVMAASAKLARPDRLRDWLLGIAASDGLTSGLRARIDDINWEAVNTHVTADVPGMRDSSARRASLRHWLEQIVATLPEPRQRLFDLFVARGLDSRNAALELSTNAAEVWRLRRENRQAILRAFEVTALAAAEAALDPPGSDAPGCGELRQILADAQHDGDRQEGGRRHIAVLPVALRLTVTRHLSQCGSCQGRRDDCMARWAPELLPVLADTELNEQVMENSHPAPDLVRPRDTPGVPRGVASVGTGGTAVARKSAAATGAGLLVALLLLAFVWPGFLHSTGAFAPRDSTTPSSRDPSSEGQSGTTDGVPGHTYGRQVRPGAAGLLNSLPPEATGSLAVPSSSASPTLPVQHVVQPSTSTLAPQPTSGRSPTSSPPALSPSPSAPQPTKVPSTPPTSPAPSTPPPTTPPPSTPSPPAPASSTAPSPTLVPSTPAPS